MSFNIAHERSKFPSLNLTLHGDPVVFFDNPGGTQVPQRVIDAVSSYYLYKNANMGGGFMTSDRTDETLHSARKAMADLLNAPDPRNIVFGANMTTLTFHLARSVGRTIRPRDEIIVSDLDHDANVTPWTDLKDLGAVIKTLPLSENCTLDMEQLAGLVGPKTVLLAITGASNAVGTMPDIATAIKIAHSVGAKVFIDAVQLAPHAPIDVQSLDCDFLACSAYKFFGPHVGILYGKTEWLEALTPHKVRPSKNEIPYRWETGTLNFEGLAGVAAAVDYLASVNEDDDQNDRKEALKKSMEHILRYEAELTSKLLTGLLGMQNITVYGITDLARINERLPTVAFNYSGVRARQVTDYLATKGIFCWSGNYYALRLMESLGLEATGGAVRIGLTHYNTADEIDRFLTAMSEFNP